MKKYLWVFLILLFACPALATDYYVDADASGANNGTSKTDAWESFADINWTTVDTGNGKLFICGTHSETLTIGQSGEDGTPIGIYSCTIANGASADDPGIVDGGSSRSNNIVGNGKDYITIDGLTTQNCTGGSGGSLYFTGCDHIVVQNCIVTEPRNRGIRFSDDCDYCTAKDNTVSVGSAQESFQTDGIVFFGDATYQTGNICDGNVVNQYSNDPGGDHLDPIQTYKQEDFTCKNNWAQNHDGGGACQAVLLQDHIGDLYVYNNVVINCDSCNSSCSLGLNKSVTWTADIYIWNNTIVHEHATGHALTLEAITSSYLKEVKNNVLIAEGNGYACNLAGLNPGDPSIVDYNCLYSAQADVARYNWTARTWAEWQTDGFDANGINTDPSLDANYEPDSADDPVVDAGTTIGSFSTDKNGVSRPQGSAWDIGAYEYWLGTGIPGPGCAGTFILENAEIH